MKQTSMQLDEETIRNTERLAVLWDSPNRTAVIRQAVQVAIVLESARRSLPDSEFVGFLAELYRPID